jgi:hypothetical protein
MPHKERPTDLECPDWGPATPGSGSKKCVHYPGGGGCLLGKPACTEWLKVNPGRTPTYLPALPGAGGAGGPGVARASSPPQAAPGAPGANGLSSSASARPGGAQEPERVNPGSGPTVLAQGPAWPGGSGGAGPRKVEDPHDPAPLALAPSEVLAPKPAAKLSAAERTKAMFETLAARVHVDPPPFEPAKAIAEQELDALAKVATEIHLVSPELGDVWLVKAYTANDGARMEVSFKDAATIRLLIDSFPGSRVVELVKPSQDGAE